MMTPLNAIFLTIAIIIVLVFIVGNDKRKEFKKWFEALKRMAPHYGYTYEDIKDFMPDEFRDYFEEGMDVEMALKAYLSED